MGIYLTFRKLCRGCVKINGDAIDDPPAESDDPVVSIVSPVDGAAVPKNFAISVNAFDVDGNGTLAKVEFYDGAIKLGEVSAAPYNFVWNNAANGPHTLTAVATDGSGMTATSPPIHITVTGAPSVALTNPASDTVIVAPGTISLQATASDPDGTIARVEFYHGDVKIGEDTTSPYSFAWTNISAATYNVTAKAIDNLGLATISEAVVLTVNTAPSITLVAPTTGQILQAPAAVVLIADVVDTDGTIQQVDFYQGTTLIGTATTFPFAYNWTSIPYGSYNLTAKAKDNRSTVTTSAPVNLIVNAAPTVNITSPANHAMIAPGSNLAIDVNAADPDGTITQVEFYQGTTLIGTDTTSPYSLTLNNVAPGSYAYMAKAMDNRGVVTTSTVIVVTTPVFSDDFNDNSLNASKWSIITSGSPATITEQGQQLRITLPASTSTYNGIVSNGSYDMRGATVQVELAQSVSQAGWTENMLKIEKDALNYLLIDTGAGNILYRSMVNGVSDQLVTPFDAVAHRYWRVRHDTASNAINFETSQDALLWTTRKTVAVGFSLTSVRFSLIAGAYGSGNANPGVAIYNDFQLIGGATTLLSEDFDDNVFDTSKWITNNLFSGYTDINVAMNETAQRLEIGPLLQGASGSHYRGIVTATTYNFTGGAASVELIQPASATTEGDAMFTVGLNVDNYYRLYVSGGNLFGLKKIGAIKTTLFTIPYDAVNHRFLRIRHDAATNCVILETAPSSGSGPGTWVQRYNQLWSSSVQLANTVFELKGGTWQPETNAAGKVIFDNLLVTK